MTPLLTASYVYFWLVPLLSTSSSSPAFIGVAIKSSKLAHQLTNKPICERSSGDCDDRIREGMYQRREQERDVVALNRNG